MNTIKSVKAFCFCVLNTLLIAQIEVPKGDYPFHTIVEWPNVGVVLMGNDPEESKRDYNLTLVNLDGEVQWKEKFYPKSPTPKYIAGISSGYIYFFDDFEIERTSMEYHQISKSGSVISSSVNFLQSFKKFGYNDPSDADLIDIINTPSALVFQFSFKNKDEKQFDNILIFLTHHNHRIYPVSISPTPFSSLKDELIEQPYYAGGKKDEVYFASYQKKGVKNRIVFTQFTSKGEPKGKVILPLSNFSPVHSNIKPMHFSASYYLHDESKMEIAGRGVFFNDRFYYFENNLENLCLIIWSMGENGKVQKRNDCKLKADDKRKNDGELLVYHLNNSFIVKSTLNNLSSLVKVNETSVETRYKDEIDGINEEDLLYNPSLINFQEQPNEFVIHLNEKNYSFDKNQLGQHKNLIFEEK